MAYKALYRTYRPSSFAEVVGQKHIVTTLKNAVSQNKIAHAYLFCGPRGTGKTSIAKLLAKTVNCLDSENAPCGKCDNCLEIQKGSYPDIVEIDAASNNGVDEIRDLIEKVKYAPIQGKYKVYIIDEVHMLSQGAFNALLKTLEEPPSHVIFILATTEPHKVIPTIISRCQRYDFTKVSNEDIASKIREVLGKEEIKYDEEIVELVSILADGGMRDALSILDQCIAYASDYITVKHVNEIYGITTPKEKFELLVGIMNHQVQTVLDKIKEVSEKGMDIKRLTNDLMDILKEVVVYGYTKDTSVLSKIDIERAKALLSLKSESNMLSMIDTLMETTEKYRNALSIVSYFELCLLKMMSENNVLLEQKTPNVIIQPNSLDKTTQKIHEDKEEKVEVIKTEISEPIHEDLKLVEEDTNSTILEREMILKLLVSADKGKRTALNEKWSSIDQYLTDLQYARFANKFVDSKLEACGEGFIVISVAHLPIATDINEAAEDGNMIEFIQLVMEERMKVFAVEKNEFKSIVEEFIQKSKSNQLPEPIHIKLSSAKVKEDKKPEDKLEDLFGKGMFEIVEE